MKSCSIAIFCALAMGAQADFSQFNAVTGSMNVFDHFNKQKGGYLWNSTWGLPDLQAITTDNLTFELKPNINAYNAADPYWSDGAGDGNKWMSANTIWERTVGAGDSSVSFTYSVDSYAIAPRYSVSAFVKILDSLGGSYGELIIDSAPITQVSGSDVTLTINFAAGAYTGQLLQMGFVMEGMNANPATDWGSVTVTAVDASVTISDNEAPTPNPMVFAVDPNAISDSSISMTASNAVDNAFGVEYYFTCESGPGNDSGWQTSATYVDTGLPAGSSFTYSVKARDTSPSQNETASSTAVAVTTGSVDTDAPTPNPMEISSTSSTHSSVTLTAATAMDDSSVEYKFTNVSGGGSDSDWQSSPVYKDSGLLPESVYAYTVQARDLSSATNTTASSEMVTVVTANDVPSGLVLIPNGDFENGGDQWRNAEPDGNIVLSYESTGGSGDNGGYAQHGRTGAAWAVLVNPIPTGEEGGGIPLSYFGAEAGQTLTFAMNQRTISGAAAPMLKIEAWANNERVGLKEVEATYSSDWTTHSFDWKLPAETELLLFVPVAGADSLHGYDNIGVLFNHPNAAQIQMADVAEDGSFCFEVDGMAGEIYVVQWKELLTDVGWNTVLSTNGVGTLKVAIPVDTEKEQLFYRIISTF